MLSSTSSFITVTSCGATFGTIPPGESVTTDRNSWFLETATNMPTGAQYPLQLELTDADGNTITLDFKLDCVAPLASLTINPRASAVGSPVTFTANFARYPEIPDDAGIASVKVGVQPHPADDNAATGYLIDLAHVTSTTGQFEAVWTLPSSNDWDATVYIVTAFGHTNVCDEIDNGGFSSIPYDPTCGVLLYNDNFTWQNDNPPSSHAIMMQAISNAGNTCFYWSAYYRGGVSNDQFSRQPILFYYPLSGCTDLKDDTSARRAILQHLDDGGNAAIMSGSAAYSLYRSDSTGQTILANYFGCTWVTNFNRNNRALAFTNVLGLAGDPVGGGLTVAISPNYRQDEIFPVSNGIECLRYDPHSAPTNLYPAKLGTAGVRTSNTVFLAWLSRDLTDSMAFNDLVWNILAYFDAASPYVHGGNRTLESDVVMATRVLQFYWGGFDTRLLANYNVALGTAANASDVMDWTAVSPTNNSCIWSNAIVPGLTYYASVRALDHSGAVIQGPLASGPLTCLAAVNAIAGDYDGDRKADPAVYSEYSGEWTVPRSAAGYAPLTVSDFGGYNACAVPGDYDGDRKADSTICFVESGNWYIRLSGMGSAIVFFSGFGGQQCLPVSGDYDGDGRADLAIYDTTDGLWSVMLSGASYQIYSLATSGSINQLPVAADFDGDGRTDPTLYDLQTGAWTVRFSGSGYAAGVMAGFGGPELAPLVGDLDADGKADPCLYHAASGIWRVRLSTADYATTALAPFGNLRLTPALADFDGDGRADPALYDPGNGAWTVKLSTADYAIFSFSTGAPGYAPIQ